MAECKSCGMPMADAKQHGAGDGKNPYCIYCTDNKGKLKPRAEIRAAMVTLLLRKKKMDVEQAERAIDAYMAKMPAWKKRK
ncbi:MAG: zinc ribbon domain-containing protein [Candidatus Aenigmatarchaeota archaeon]